MHGELVLVAPGTHALAQSSLGKAITLQSTGCADVTTILGKSTQRVALFITNETSGVVLDGFVITGDVDGDGGFSVRRNDG